MTVAWDRSMSVGIERLDEQHQRWIALMNELIEALRERRGDTVVGTTLQKVRDYTQTHFRDEEATLLSAKYPNYAEHKAQHDAFVAELAALREEQADGVALLSVVVAKKLLDWFFRHIRIADQQYASHLAGNRPTGSC